MKKKVDIFDFIIVVILISIVITGIYTTQKNRISQLENRIETLENKVESMSYQKNDYDEIIQEMHLLLDRIDEQEGW